MPQTLGAFIAIMAVMTFSLNYHRSTLHAQRSMINSEMEVMASAIASDAMNYIASKPFDARTADKTVTRYNRNTTLLTHPSGFGSCGAFDSCSDVDDFHDLPTIPRSFEVEPGVEINFNVDVSVDYVDDAGAYSMAPTWIKEVSVKVTSTDSAEGVPYLIRPMTLTRQFSPQW